MCTSENSSELRFVARVQKRGERYGIEIPLKMVENAKKLHDKHCLVFMVPILNEKRPSLSRDEVLESDEQR